MNLKSNHLNLSFLAGMLIAVAVLHSPTTARASDPTSEQLCYLSATELIPLFTSGKLSPVDVLQAQIARIEQYEQKTNALTYTHFEAARAAAKDSERRYKEGNPRPLEGITVGIKDEHYQRSRRIDGTEHASRNANRRQTNRHGTRLPGRT